jgi:AcrR family transcriptional regulator
MLTTVNRPVDYARVCQLSSISCPGGTVSITAKPRTPSDGSLPRRDLILREAAKMFAARGFHGVGIDDIGAAAGISGPAVYRHFASKEALLAEMLTSISQRLLVGGAARVSTATSPLDALDELIDFQVAFALDEPELIVVHDRDLASLPARQRHNVRRLQREYVEVWVDVVRSVRPQAPEAEARAAVHAVFGLINSTPHSAVVASRGSVAAILRRMAVAALLSIP